MPCQKSCHWFHTEPNGLVCKLEFVIFEARLSNWPVSFVNISGNLSVSNHSSPSGVKLKEPTKVNMSNGFYIDLVANGCVIIAVSEYGK